MGRLIVDNTCEPKPMSKEEIVENLKTMVFGVQAFNRFNAKERETLDKAWNIIDQYENRLKADLKAILVELQLEIEELDVSDVVPEYQDGAEETKEYIANMIEEKINSLKEEKEMSVMKYIKKPVEIEALQIFGNITEIKKFIGNNGDAYIADAAYQAGVNPPVTVVIIHTLEGDMRATDGDYIIKGVKGEFYPCRKDIFEETYEKINLLKEK